MSDNDAFPEPQPVDVRGIVSLLIGFVLVIAGTVMAFWVFWNVYTMFTNPQSLEVFTQIMPEGQDWRELDIDGQKVTLPEGIFNFLAYSVGCFLMLVAAIIAGSFISGGAGLLQPAFQKMALKMDRKMDRKMEDLEKTVQEIGKSLDKKE